MGASLKYIMTFSAMPMGLKTLQKTMQQFCGDRNGMGHQRKVRAWKLPKYHPTTICQSLIPTPPPSGKCLRSASPDTDPEMGSRVKLIY